MKAIVVIFVQTREVQGSTVQSLAVSISESLQRVPVFGVKASRADNSTIHNEVPPFWTWFIKNPRPLDILP
jgi:hypothetical protein